jgi:hypothetical protein
MNNAVNKLNEVMLNARKEYVNTMKYESEHLVIKNISYTRIPCTESYVEDNDFGIIKTEKYGAFITDISGTYYVEIDYGYINNEYSYVNNEYVKNSEIKISE